MKPKPLKEQVIVVFGASSGIGRATALKCAQAGAKVAVAARDKIGISSLIEEIDKTHAGNSIGIIADCAKYEDIKKVADETISKWGRIDSWIQVASLFLFAGALDTTEDEYQRIMDINFMGPVRASKVAIPHLSETKGTFLVVTSAGARRSIPNNAAYAASKHAVDGFIESLRMELKHDNVPVNVVTILPGTMNTPIYDKTRNKVDGGIFRWTGPPPIYHPDLVADSIIYGITHDNVRDVVVGTAPWLVLCAQALVPSFLDWAMVMFGWQAEKSSMKKELRDNLDEPIERYDTVEGPLTNKTSNFSLYNYIIQHPWLPRLHVL